MSCTSAYWPACCYNHFPINLPNIYRNKISFLLQLFEIKKAVKIFAKTNCMEVKNLFDLRAKEDIINRFKSLNATAQPKWGKMNVAQMLNHCQKPLEVAYGTHQLKGSFLLKIIAPLFKDSLYNDKPYKQGLPTDKTFIITDSKDFDDEREKLLHLILQFNESRIVSEKHPAFGKMTKEQWSRSAWKHLDHHLKQFGA